MKKNILTVILFTAYVAFSCNQKPVAVTETQPQFNNQLTADERAGKVMTPEIMWKFGRLGTFALSPDGSAVIYDVTDRDLKSEARRTNIFKTTINGDNPVQLTTEGGSSPQWIGESNSIAFVRDGKLFTMNADGSEQKEVSGLSDFEIYNLSPDGKSIYFTRRVKLDQTANEKHNLSKAKVRIIDDLMYRHWNTWSDYSYSHIFAGSFDGGAVTRCKGYYGRPEI